MPTIFNNKFIPESKAVIPTTSKVFMYGYGVFETLRTYNGQVFKADEHIKRLFCSADVIGLKIKYNKKEIKEMLGKVVGQMEKICRGSPQRRRWGLPRQIFSIWPAQRIKIIAIEEGIIITSNKLKINKNIYKGVGVQSINCQRPFPTAKKLSFLDSFLTHSQAAKNGYYDALLIDDKSEIYEGAYSNIFWFEGNTLCTRPDKILLGITRQTVIDISPFPVKYKTITLNKLIQKKEIFLTQTTAGVAPITKIDGEVINKGVVGDRVLRVMEGFATACQI